MEQLPYAPSCDNNKDYILEVLRQVFADRKLVLEIASGTGQHACYFAQQLPWLSWQPTEIPDNLPMLQPRCALYQGDNLLREVALDVCDDPWPMAVPAVPAFWMAVFCCTPWMSEPVKSNIAPGWIRPRIRARTR